MKIIYTLLGLEVKASLTLALEWMKGHEQFSTFEMENGELVKTRLWRIGRLCVIYHPEEQALQDIGTCSAHWYWKEMNGLSGLLFSLRGSTLRLQFDHKHKPASLVSGGLIGDLT